MSGRLIILPKKSYCPWKPENVERVLRDERLAREKKEKDRKRLEDEERRTRLDVLRQNETTETEGRFNLFQQEEDAFLNSNNNNTVSSEQNRKQMGIMPVMLGQTELKTRGKNAPFYMHGNRVNYCHNDDTSQTQQQQQQQQQQLSLKEQNRKNQLDPMKAYSKTSSAVLFIKEKPHTHKKETSPASTTNGTTSNTSSDDSSLDTRQRRKRRKKERKKRRKKRKHHRHSDNTDEEEDSRKKRTRNSEKQSVDESLERMRKRRMDREAHEKLRASAVLMPDKRRLDDRGRHYQNQYNPTLSRR